MNTSNKKVKSCKKCTASVEPEDKNCYHCGSNQKNNFNSSDYIPETPFQQSGDIIYNLKRSGGYRNGKPLMKNDIIFSFQDRGISQEQRDEIMKVVVDALNKNFPPKYKIL